jgi:hypothetical protein
VAGVAGLAGVAARLAPVIARLKSHLANEVAESTLKNEEVKALATLFDHRMHWWIEKLGTQLGQQMQDVSRYLFASDGAEPQTPARTVFPWELLLPRVGEVLYRVLASATPKTARAELACALRAWRATAFPANAAKTRLVSFAIPPSKVTDGMDREHPDRLMTWQNRYFMRFRAIEHGQVVLRGIEATKDGVFRLPPGATFIEEIAADARFGDAAIDATLALLEERGRVEADDALVTRVAKKTGLVRPAAALLWSAGYDPWLVGEKARARLGLDREDMELADPHLKNERLREIYARAMPDDPKDMFGPVAADRLAEAWLTRNEKKKKKKKK